MRGRDDLTPFVQWLHVRLRSDAAITHTLVTAHSRRDILRVVSCGPAMVLALLYGKALVALLTLQLKRKGKGYIAVPTYEGSLAEATKVPVAKPVRSGSAKKHEKPSHSVSDKLIHTFLFLGH
eukprot:134501-Pelagomonas_calceolata.AAC.1